MYNSELTSPYNKYFKLKFVFFWSKYKKLKAIGIKNNKSMETP